MSVVWAPIIDVLCVCVLWWWIVSRLFIYGEWGGGMGGNGGMGESTTTMSCWCLLVPARDVTV